ncbi:CYTH and CHAD domain-containing protein [Acidovorax carolinensis]|uniref:CYTH and CHAD domain-containing protein n=1 Tax=Acidovorax carolinensis TaxID=553814 RepID=UPI000B34686B|nr:CYTH and CHAD domain-containing protein [Acidovorax carolinensis]ART49603.1 inorganic triphosphatase [Acidovorax carolinensis]
MPSTSHPGPGAELEIKLALPTSNPAGLARQLARLPTLARRQPVHKQVDNIYYDTPGQALRAQRMALRLRRVGGVDAPQWLQTLKTSDSGDSALSLRGEWEVPVPGPALVQAALQAAPPWQKVDPDGAVFAALAPCFATDFERTAWTVRRRDGSAIEVALDMGQITCGQRSVPICELELELLAGPPAALFDLARQIAQHIAVLPLAASKAQRGYELRDGKLDTPLRARPPQLGTEVSLRALVQPVLGEMFAQFTANLNALVHSDAPELVHQARVGWRRFRGALRLFKPAAPVRAVPAWPEMQPMLVLLGELRDLDVACTQTLPALQDAFVAGDAGRAERWQAMAQAFQQAALQQRQLVRRALQEPAVGAALLSITLWLDDLARPQAWGESPDLPGKTVRHWVRQRIQRLHAQWKKALRDSTHAESQHRARILAKRLRYNIEALRPLLPGRAQRWLQQATQLQAGIGASRDVLQAGVLAQRLAVDRGIVEFLRGFAAGQAGVPLAPPPAPPAPGGV